MKSIIIATCCLFASAGYAMPVKAADNDTFIIAARTNNSSTQYSEKTRDTINKIKSQSSADEVKRILKSANYLRRERRFNEFIAIWSEAVQWLQKHKEYGPEHQKTSSAYRVIGDTYKQWGKIKEAIVNYKQAIASLKNTSFNTKQYQLQILHNKIGIAYSQDNYGKKAIFHYERSLELSNGNEEQYGKIMATTMYNLAIKYSNNGKMADADKILQDALRIRINKFGKDHHLVGSILQQQASIYNSLGKHQRALIKSQEAYEIVKHLDKNDPRSIDAQISLIARYNSLKMFKEADAMSKEILIRSRKKAKDFPNDPGIQKQLSNDVASYAMQRMFIKEYSEAEALMQEAIAIAKPYVSGEDRHSLAQLSQYAYLKQNQADWKSAGELRKKRYEVAIRRNDRKSLIQPLIERGEVAIREGDGIRAEQEFRTAIENQISLTVRDAPFLPRNLRSSAYYSTINHYLPNMAIRYSWRNDIPRYGSKATKALADLGFYERINRHGLLAQIEKIQSQLLLLDSSNRSVVNNLNIITGKLANLSISKDERKQLVLDREKLERKLYRLLPSIEHKPVSLDEIANSLPNDGVLIEFQKYKYLYDGQSQKRFNTNRLNGDRYMAMILKANGTTHYVDLGEASEIDESVARTYSAITKLNAAERELARMAQLVIEPLLDSIGGAKTWFISPDGELNRLPFAALKDKNNSIYLTDKVNLRLLTTGRELMEIKKKNNQSSNKILIIADPLYDDNTIAKKNFDSSLNQETDISLMRSSTLDNKLRWAPLPGTEIEGKQIAAITEGELLMQANATANEVKRARSPKILHLATHAFYLPDQKKKSNPLAGDNRDNRGGVKISNFSGEDPLLRSGIALAGANNPKKNSSDDGYLTALEFARLDLEGTELVVISACQSGLGDIKHGEGVYGLKRAIAVAGAKSSLLSLWLVDDAATAAFMESFYKRLKAGEARGRALAETQEEFRNHPIPLWREPFVWAAFQLSGDWKAIDDL